MRSAIVAGGAAASIGLGLAWVGWTGADRDEIGLLVTWVPALLAVLALALAGSGRGARAAGYGAMLLTTAVGEAALLGNAGVPVMRVAAVGCLVAALFDLVARAGMAVRGRWVAAVGLAILLAIPGGGGWYMRAAAPDGTRPTGQRVMVLAGVPLRWTEGGVDLRSGPDAAWRMLSKLFRLEPADDVATSTARRWLLVQPRTPTPAALVTIDARVRAGVHEVILTDPDLRWPSRYLPGDPAGPPRAGTLGPLLLHWGLVLRPGGGAGVRDVTRQGRTWRLWLAGAGRLERRGAGPCRIEADGLIATCRLGRGTAVLVADADLLDPAGWADDDGGWEPAWRRSDNAAFVAALLAGPDMQPPAARPVAWRAVRDPHTDHENPWGER